MTATSDSKRNGGGGGVCMPPSLTEIEFQALPDSIQRKYFSTLERLRIAQNSAQIYCAPPPSARTGLHSLPSGKSTASKLNGPSSNKRTRLRHSNGSGSHLLISKAEAHWYQSLPEKVRRQHFSREEQILLSARVDAEASFISTVSSQYNTPRVSTQSLPRRGSRSGPRRVSNRSSKANSPEPIRSPNRVSGSAVLDPLAMNCFDTCKPAPGQFSKKSSVQRTLSRSRPIGGNSSLFRQSTSSERTVPQSPMSPTLARHNRNRSRASALRASTDSATRPVDPGATHYRDPDARKKLRQYLASPQKFDEAVEFGFPSQSSAPVVDPDIFKVTRSTSANDAQTFLKQDVITFIDRYDDDTEDESIDSAPDSPVTPADANDFFPKPYGSSIFAGIDATDVPSLNFKFENDHDIFPLSKFPQDPLANREMTLRMTLTRADLRATEDDLYGWTKKEDDPLALEELEMTDDTTGAHGAFAIKPTNHRRSGLFKKLFDKVKTDRRH